jgi:D-alanyl-lipoteichoic acid acyltransferase DltB (MBOAT superfamily)
MSFTSCSFIVFFLITFSIYWALPERYRWILLLLSSLTFYAFAGPIYLVVLVSTILVNYFLAVEIDRKQENKNRNHLLFWGIVLNLIVLSIFKYYDAASELLAQEFHLAPNSSSIPVLVMPLGISFYTFTSISYLIEVKRRNIEAEKHLGYFSVYITFFPKLIMGPIERPQFFLPQVNRKKVFDYNQATQGMRLILLGAFKKLVVANRMANFVNPVFEDPWKYSGISLAVAVVFFAVQIYADFSGYIDIARGISNLLGFNLSHNFNRPYAARSIKEFWSRWHITLSTWLRDYIFLPIAYSLSRRFGRDHYLRLRTDHFLYLIAITITFLICGIWHGVGWTFLIWGLLFVIYLSIARLTEKGRRKLRKVIGISKVPWLDNSIQVIATFLLVCFAWIFFKSQDIDDAYLIIRSVFNITSWTFHVNLFGKENLPEFLITIFLMALILFLTINKKAYSSLIFGIAKPKLFRWTLYFVITALILYFGVFNNYQFIYFQF